MADPVGRVCIAWEDGPTTAAPTWYRLDDQEPGLVSEITITSGRQDELDQTQTGTATVTINDRTDWFGPDFIELNQLEGKQIALSLWDPVQEQWYIRFRGVVDDIGYDLHGSGKVSNVELGCVGFFDYLAGIQFVPDLHGSAPPAGSEGIVYYPAQEVDDRIIALLEDAGIDSAMYVVFSGNVNVQGTKYDPSDAILQAIRDAADAEFPGIANVFEDRRGRICFHGRGARIDPDGVSAGAGDAAWDFQRWGLGDGAAIVADPTRGQLRPPLRWRRSRSRVVNSCIAYPRGVAETAIPGLAYEDATSITAYGRHSLSFEDLIISGHKTNGNTAVDECLLFSTFYVENFKQPRNRLETVTVKSLEPDDARAAATWEILARSDISDIVNVEFSYPGAVSGISEDFYLEGWTQTIRPHKGDAQTGWYDYVELTMNVSPAAYYTTDVWV